MNTEVSATSMQVRAVAEQGILINEVATATDANWDNLATAAQTDTDSASMLYPASTTNGTTWYHAASKKSSSAASATADTPSTDLVNGYETLSSLTAITAQSAAASAGSTAKRETMGRATDATAGYYVHYEYYLKSSGSAIDLTGTGSGSQKLNVKSVTATATANNTGTGSSGSTELNKSLRVGIKFADGGLLIYAPITGFTSSYYVNAGSTATQPIAGTTSTASALETLPASSAAGTKVDVYIWYEGEDAGCKTDNATAAVLDNIKVDIVFALVTAA